MNLTFYLKGHRFQIKDMDKTKLINYKLHNSVLYICLQWQLRIKKEKSSKHSLNCISFLQYPN